MSALRTNAVTTRTVVLAVGLPLTALGTALGIRAGMDLPSVAGAVFVVAVLVALFLVPVHWLPAASLLMLAFVPSRFIPNDGPFRALTPLTAIILIWVFRRLVLRQTPPAIADLPPLHLRGARLFVYVPAVFVVLWVLYSLATSMLPQVSASWSISFLSAVVAPLLVPDSRAEGVLLRKAILWAGAILGAYAVVEMLLQSSPLYGTIYDIVGRTSTDARTWSVYRAMASFSHPLFAGAFLTIPAALGLATWMQTGRLRYLVCAVLSTLGVFGTVSRGALLAVAAAAAVVFAAALFDRVVRVRARMLGFALLGMGAFVLVANYGPLQERADSIEAVRSAETRELGVIVALKTAQHYGWVGSGPGTSGMATDLFKDIPIENSAMQLLVSIGIPGVLAVAALIAGLVVNALAVRDFGAAAVAVSVTVAFLGFNVIDAVYYMHALIGVIVLLSVSAYAPPSADVAPLPRPTPATHAPPRPLPTPSTTGGSPWT